VDSPRAGRVSAYRYSRRGERGELGSGMLTGMEIEGVAGLEVSLCVERSSREILCMPLSRCWPSRKNVSWTIRAIGSL
jgi:hypothetical protein